LSDPAALGMLEQIKAILRCISKSNTEVKKAAQFSELQSFFRVRTSVCPWEARRFWRNAPNRHGGSGLQLKR
jgi:hypothetical protein